MKIRKAFTIGSLAGFGLLAGTFTHAAVPGPIHLAALLDTNDPTSVVAFLTLTGSNLDFVIMSPSSLCPRRIDIVVASSGSLPGEVLWTIPAPATNSGPHISPGIDACAGPREPCPPPRNRLPTILTNSITVVTDQTERLLNGLGLIKFQSQGCPFVAVIRVLDSDGDGVRDSQDLCPDTPTGSLVNADGCSIDQLAPCDGDWKNHGEFVVHFRKVTAEFQAAGFITPSQERALNRASSQSDCGK